MGVAVEAGSSLLDGTDLDPLADTAQRALGSDAVAIVLLSAGDRPAIVASAGLSAGQRDRLEPGLRELCDGLEAGLPGSPGTRPASSPSRSATLLRHGYAGALAAAAPLSPGRSAAVLALKRDDGGFDNLELVNVFATQAATALARPSRRRRLDLTADRLEGVIALDQLALSATSVEQLCAALNGAIAPLVGAASTGIMVWDGRRQVLRMLAGSFGADEVSVASCQISAADFRTNSARVFSAGRGFYSNDVRREPALFKDFVEAFALERVLSVPLIHAGRPIGVLHLANKRDEFTADDLDRIEALAPKIATVVEIAQAHLRLRRQRRLEELLAEVAVALASGVGVRDFLGPAFVELGEVAEASLLALVLDDGGETIRWRKGDLGAQLERLVLAEARGRPGIRAYVVGPETTVDPGWAAFHVPVHLGNQRLGTLVAVRGRAEPFAQEERHAIVRLANLAALARATDRYQQQRAELARLHERQRIADDLHDDVAQLLFAAQLSLDVTLERDDVDGAAAEAIAQARGLLVRGDTAIRTVIDRLAGPPQSDLALRLASAVAQIEDVCSQAVHLEISDGAAAAGNHVRRAAGDTLVQVARHAVMKAAEREGPQQITVRLRHAPAGPLVLTVEAEGAGDLRRDTRHLTPLRQQITENGGSLGVRHGQDGATVITASVPV